MAAPGVFYVLRRAVGVTQEQRNQLFAPLQGQFPQDEDQLNHAIADIRRMANLVEHNPMSVR
eukprot:10648486-Lingulodinium_polyedra.AAC.1